MKTKRLVLITIFSLIVLLPIVAHEECSAIFEPAVEMDHGDTAATRLGDDAIAGLKNDTARDGHNRRPLDCAADPAGGADVPGSGLTAFVHGGSRNASARKSMRRRTFNGRNLRVG